MSNITTDQVTELIAQDKSGRVTRELLQAFLRNPQGYVNGQPREYTVTVDYRMSLEQMIKAGRVRLEERRYQLAELLRQGRGYRRNQAGTRLT